MVPFLGLRFVHFPGRVVFFWSPGDWFPKPNKDPVGENAQPKTNGDFKFWEMPNFLAKIQEFPNSQDLLFFLVVISVAFL